MVASSNLDMIKKWQADFEKGDFAAVVSIFADDAIVTIGDGDSEAAVAYGGRFVGIEQIKYFYAGRLNAGIHPLAVIRPFCIVENLEREFGRWVIIGGQIHDTRKDKTPVYKGQYMQVWSINADRKVASLSMFFDVDAVLPATP
jgi:ketosteroid isomerase-like protein